jgi:dGTPase
MAELPDHLLRRGERWRAPYACDPARSLGRVHPEAEDPLRSPFQRDRDRIIHSNAFRRLKHKTQVFILHEGDHFRTRLTHTLEVAQIARSIARALGLDEDLTESLALAHDLGHPPFGHAGERALAAALANHGGFDHNAQSLRIVTVLEKRYPNFDGLNLAWETLEGLAKHNGPLLDRDDRPLHPDTDGQLPFGIRDYPHAAALALHAFPSLEAQAAAISDDIAYDCHDLDDGLRAGLLKLGDLGEEGLAGETLAKIRSRHPQLDDARTGHELVRRLISAMISDVVAETARRLASRGIDSAEAARAAGRPLVGFSAEMADPEAGLKRYLYDHLYRHEAVMRSVREAEEVVGDLFASLAADPSRLPAEWAATLNHADPGGVARRVGDYIAGMTDRFAMAEHRRLFDATADLS